MKSKGAGEYLESVIISAGIIGTDAAATMTLCDHAVSPPWASDLPLKGDGYISGYYKKD